LLLLRRRLLLLGWRARTVATGIGTPLIASLAVSGVLTGTVAAALVAVGI